MWTFTLPRMLRLYFLHHRRLLGKLCRAAYETVRELMASAAIGVEGFRAGMVAAVHLCGDLLTPNPHVHALAPRGSWDEEGGWVPVPFVDERCAELLFRNKVLDLLSDEGLLSEERQQLLLSWRHRTGFSADASVKVEPEDSAAVQRQRPVVGAVEIDDPQVGVRPVGHHVDEVANVDDGLTVRRQLRIRDPLEVEDIGRGEVIPLSGRRRGHREHGSNEQHQTGDTNSALHTLLLCRALFTS
jgi:hypothetical protein